MSRRAERRERIEAAFADFRRAVSGALAGLEGDSR